MGAQLQKSGCLSHRSVVSPTPSSRALPGRFCLGEGEAGSKTNSSYSPPSNRARRGSGLRGLWTRVEAVMKANWEKFHRFKMTELNSRPAHLQERRRLGGVLLGSEQESRLTSGTNTSKDPKLDWISLQNSLCPRALLKTTEPRAGKFQNKTDGCWQRNRMGALPKPLSSQGDWAYPRLLLPRKQHHRLNTREKWDGVGPDLMKIILPVTKHINKPITMKSQGRKQVVADQYTDLFQYITKMPDFQEQKKLQDIQRNTNAWHINWKISRQHQLPMRATVCQVNRKRIQDCHYKHV